MKKLYSLALAVLAVSCGPQIDLTERPLFRNGVNTLTFMLYNAFTGEPINDATATISMNLGNYQLNATHQENNNVLVLSQVPYGSHLVTVTAPGFVGFLGEPFAPCNYDLVSNPGPQGQCYQNYQVALYPTDSVSGAVTVRAFEQSTGSAIASGTAVATLVDADTLVGSGFNNPLSGSLSTRPNTIVRTLDANGSATFEGANLVMGGVYSVDIYNARNGAGELLNPEENVTFQAGADFPTLTVFMGPPSEYPVALATSFENNTHSVAQSAFTVDFPYEVELCSNPEDHNWYASVGGGDGDGDLVVVAAAADPVLEGSGNGGTRLILTPAFSVPPDTGDGHLDITFYNVEVRVAGAGTCVDLSSIQIRNDSWVDPTIHAVNP